MYDDSDHDGDNDAPDKSIGLAGRITAPMALRNNKGFSQEQPKKPPLNGHQRDMSMIVRPRRETMIADPMASSVITEPFDFGTMSQGHD